MQTIKVYFKINGKLSAINAENFWEMDAAIEAVRAQLIAHGVPADASRRVIALVPKSC